MLTLCAVGAARERLDSCSYLGEASEGLLSSMTALTASSLIDDEAVQVRRASAQLVWSGLGWAGLAVCGLASPGLAWPLLTSPQRAAPCERA